MTDRFQMDRKQINRVYFALRTVMPLTLAASPNICLRRAFNYTR
jgi:hypothetical protein